MANKNLHKAKAAKNDEFYTQLHDIENELKHYRPEFKGKTVFLNCDDPDMSHFWGYFVKLNFDFLEIKKVISTHFEAEKPSYKLEHFRNEEGELVTIKTPLKGNGDFRSPECVALLDEADIVVTNPPFSLFREFIELLVEKDKKLLVVGSMNAITYKEVFKHIMAEKLWLGVNPVKEFKRPDGVIQKFGNILWFTNMEHKKRREEILLFADFNEEDYPTYDNYAAINVDKVAFIPKDYYGVMGVPITFLTKFNPDQFEIVSSDDFITSETTKAKGHGLIKDKDGAINGKPKYARIVIRRTPQEEK